MSEKKRIIRMLLTAVLLLSVLFVSALADDAAEESIGFDIIAPKTISKGQTTTLTVQFTNGNVPNQEVRWYSSDPQIASIDKKTGELTGKAKGTVTITAESEVYGIRDEASVTVEHYPVTNIEIKAPEKVAVGFSDTMTISVKPDNATIPNFRFSQNKSHEGSVTLYLLKDGRIKIVGEKAGKVTIRVIAEDNPKVYADVTLEIVEPIWLPIEIHCQVGGKNRCPDNLEKADFSFRVSLAQGGKTYTSYPISTNTTKFLGKKKVDDLWVAFIELPEGGFRKGAAKGNITSFPQSFKAHASQQEPDPKQYCPFCHKEIHQDPISVCDNETCWLETVWICDEHGEVIPELTRPAKPAKQAKAVDKLYSYIWKPRLFSINDGGTPVFYINWKEYKVFNFYALPEDNIGAYAADQDGNVLYYLLFNNYSTCMEYLGDREMCLSPKHCMFKDGYYPIDENGE